MVMKHKKETFYPVHVGLKMTAKMGADVQSIADRADISLSAAIRRCVEKGFPSVRQSLRPSRRNNKAVRKQTDGDNE